VKLAGSLGAGRVLLGSIVGPGNDLTISATLYEAPTGREVATSSVSGSVEELTLLIDQLTAEVLSLDAGQGQDRLASLTSTSPAALKAYLEGMNLYRRGLYREATESFIGAVREDSTFALAGLYMSESNQMVAGGVAGASIGSAAVHRHRDHLSPRDRAYSTFVLPDSGDTRTQTQRMQQAVGQFPERAEAWYRYADDIFHSGALAGDTTFLARAKEGFARAVSLDSSYWTPLHHLVWIAAYEGDTAFVRRTASHYLEGETDGSVAAEMRFRIARLDGDSTFLQRQELGRLPSEFVAFLTMWLPIDRMSFGDFAWGPGAADFLLQQAATPAAKSDADGRVYYVARNVGRWSTANASLDRYAAASVANAAERPREDIYSALYWDADPARAASSAARLAAVVASGKGTAADEWALALWRVHSGENASAVSETIRRFRQLGARPVDSIRVALLELELAARSNEPRVDSLASALDARIRVSAPSYELRSQVNLTLARVFLARAHAQEAYAAARRVLWNLNGDLYSSTFLLEQARTAAATSRKEEAIREYEMYLAMRANPDPPLAPIADSARAELAALKAPKGR
jgi:hypothetical protein